MSAQAVVDPLLLLDAAQLTAETLAPQTNWSAIGNTEHFVQFYEDDAFLLNSLTHFAGAGLRQEEIVIVIATTPHRVALQNRLLLEGLDPASASAKHQFLLLDASETLSKFMVDGAPDAALFTRVVGELIGRASKLGQPIRAFGEMVALLWGEGNKNGAIQLEELWNDLAKTYRFCLFCAYPLKDCRGEKNGQPFLHVCQAHTRVIPAESYTAQADAEKRLRAITLLQQRAGSLEAEIIERKEIEKRLVRRERELSDFLENATEAIHQVGGDGVILWANQAELDLLGYASEDYVGHHISKFHADAEVIADMLERLGRGERLHEYEARLKHKDGSIRFVSLNSSAYLEDGEFVHSRCFTRDITQQKRAADILEETVVQRTAQLRETVAELEAFSYSISHDMRSPLRAMQGYAKVVMDDYGSKLDPEAIENLQRIQRASQRLDMLVRDVLAYSKLAKAQITLQAVALGELVEDIIHEQPEFDGVKDWITVEHPLATILGHEACLIQCLTNLISNALKFVAPGVTPRVRILTENVGSKVRVWVIDNGIGIHPDHRDRVFEIFGRVYPEKRYPGTGIGLAIVKKAVARMGGETGFESELGNGCRFWFTLPNPAHVH